MNLKLVFRIFAGFAAFFALMSLLATDAMMESYGMEMSSESNLLIQFMVMVQLMFAIVVWQLPSWLGESGQFGASPARPGLFLGHFAPRFADAAGGSRPCE